MRTLELDFHSRPQASPLGWGLLVLGIFAVTVSLFYQWRLTMATDVQQNHLARAEQVLPGPTLANGVGTQRLSVIQEAEL